MSEKSDRVFSDSRLGTDADVTVRPLHAGTPAIPRSCRCRGIAPSAVSDRRRAGPGEQLVPNQRPESRRSLADDGWEQQQPRSPCTTAAALCLPAAMPAHMMPSAPMQACIHDAHSTRSSHALRMLLQTFCRRVLTARRSEMLLVIALDVLVPRVAPDATRRLRMSSVMPTSRSRSFASHGPLGYLRSPWSSGRPETAAVARWLGMVVSDTLAGYVSNKSDVNVR